MTVAETLHASRGSPNSNLPRRPDWPTYRAKFLFQEIDHRSVSGVEQRLSVSHITGVTARDLKKITMFEAESYVGHKLCEPGDVVINTMWAWMGGLGVSGDTGLVSPSYAVYRPTDLGVYEALYLDRLLRSAALVAEYTRRSTGIRGSRLRLYPPRFLDMRLPLPPMDEQRRIAAKLFERENLVADFIGRKRRQASLLAEERRAVVDAAVAGRGSPEPRLDTNVTWFPSAPASWQSLRLKYLVRHCTEAQPVSPGESVVALENVQSWTGRLIGEPAEVSGPVKAFGEGDVLFGRLRPYLAKVLAADRPGTCVGEMLVLRPDQSLIVPEFLALKLRSTPLIGRVTRATQGAKMPRADWGFLGTLRIHFPPVFEQLDIVREVQARCRLIDKGLERIDREVALALEFAHRYADELVLGRATVDATYHGEMGLLTPLTKLLLDQAPVASESDEGGTDDPN